MQLGIAKVIVNSLGFGLRHFVAFYALGVLSRLPAYLHSFLPREKLGIPPGSTLPDGREIPESLLNYRLQRPVWETDFALPMIETLLFGFAVAVAVQILLADRRGKDWAVFSALGGVLRQTPTVLGVGIVLALMGSLAQLAMAEIPFAAILVAPLYVIVALALCVAMACAAVENSGTLDCLERSVELTRGSRWRILGIFLLSVLPLAVAFFGFALALELGLELEGFEISPLMTLLGTALGDVYFVPLCAVIHEALVALREGPGAQVSAKVFD
ncbi:hypothetical protein [Pelagibius sp.]|uniref:hypothetical protein n=1 Tax=Pelagibius sp. TaxID=1931238 RepID=UPI00263165EC|nr:hypothetical protein [Pelagibius sp.]